MVMSTRLCHPDMTMQLKRREREAKAKIDKLMQGLRGIFSSSVTNSTKNTAGSRFLIRKCHLCVSAEMEQQQEALRMLQEGNTLLVAKSEQLPAALERLQAELESEKENFESARFAVEQAELARERKKKHLRDGHELYESRLALKIQTSKKDGMNDILTKMMQKSVEDSAMHCAQCIALAVSSFHLNFMLHHPIPSKPLHHRCKHVRACSVCRQHRDKDA